MQWHYKSHIQQIDSALIVKGVPAFPRVTRNRKLVKTLQTSVLLCFLTPSVVWMASGCF